MVNNVDGTNFNQYTGQMDSFDDFVEGTFDKTAGVYLDIPLTGGTGSGATVDFTVPEGFVLTLNTDTSDDSVDVGTFDKINGNYSGESTNGGNGSGLTVNFTVSSAIDFSTLMIIEVLDIL